MSASRWDMQKVAWWPHSARRTSASASAKVGSRLGYQAAWRTGRRVGQHRRMGQQRHQREQPQQRRRRPPDGQLRPLALGLDAEVAADLFLGHFHLPAQHEPAQDLGRVGGQVGAQQRLRVELRRRGSRMSTQRMRHGREAAVIPDRRLRDDLDGARPRAVPVGDGDGRPEGRRVGQAGGQGRQALRLSGAGGRRVPGGRGGAGSYSAASRRRRVTIVTGRRRPAQRASRSSTA